MATDLVSVISSRYCLPDSIDLMIDMEKGVMHINSEIVFHLKHPSFSSRVLFDASGDSLFTLYKKKMTAHGRYKVFEGDSTDSSNLLFTVKRSSMVPSLKNIDLDIFLASNKNKESVDFKVKVNGSNKSCDIYAGDCSRIVALMETKDGFLEVSVRPNIDYAFIVAVLIIVSDNMQHFNITLKDLSLINEMAKLMDTAVNSVKRLISG